MKKTILFTLVVLLGTILMGCSNTIENLENENEEKNNIPEEIVIEEEILSIDMTWIGQAGFILEIDGKSICIDPYLTDSLAAKENLVRMVPVPVEPEDLDIDLYLITHNHGDHFDEATLVRVDKTSAIFAGPDSCNAHFKAIGIEDENIILVNREDSFEYEGMTITGVYAEHTNDSIGYVIEYDELTLYFLGDSTYTEILTDVKSYNPDILVCCINGRAGNMGCEDAAKLAVELGVQYAVPCHYGMFVQNTEDPENFRIALEETDVKYMEMKVLETNTIIKKEGIIEWNQKK